jgi:hypothetical protein
MFQFIDCVLVNPEWIYNHPLTVELDKIEACKLPRIDLDDRPFIAGPLAQSNKRCDLVLRQGRPLNSDKANQPYD